MTELYSALEDLPRAVVLGMRGSKWTWTINWTKTCSSSSTQAKMGHRMDAWLLSLFSDQPTQFFFVLLYCFSTGFTAMVIIKSVLFVCLLQKEKAVLFLLWRSTHAWAAVVWEGRLKAGCKAGGGPAGCWQGQRDRIPWHVMIGHTEGSSGERGKGGRDWLWGRHWGEWGIAGIKSPLALCR